VREIVVIGGSAGALSGLGALAARLPPRVAASFFAVLHVLSDSGSHIVDTLNASGSLLTKHPRDGEAISHGVMYVAPPDRHLLVKRGYVRVTRGPRENRWRPAVDPLFRSAAVAYGPRVIGVVLSGMLDDGTAGLIAVKRCGGIAIVQDPDEAQYADMPRHALQNADVDYCVTLEEMAPLIEKLLAEPVADGPSPPPDLAIEASIAETGHSDQHMAEAAGELTTLSCPECDGPLWQQDLGSGARFRCRVGHAYGGESLAAAEQDRVEMAVWAAIRILDQRANVLTTLADKDRTAGRIRMFTHQTQLAQEARANAELLRTLLVGEKAETQL